MAAGISDCLILMFLRKHSKEFTWFKKLLKNYETFDSPNNNEYLVQFHKWDLGKVGFMQILPLPLCGKEVVSNRDLSLKEKKNSKHNHRMYANLALTLIYTFMRPRLCKGRTPWKLCWLYLQPWFCYAQ